MEYENQDTQDRYELVMMPEVAIKGKKAGMMLIQWEEDNTLHRSWVTSEQVVENPDGRFYAVDPHVGVPYGFDFTKLVTLKTTAKVLDREIKRREIWTLEDLRANPAALVSAIQAAYGVTRATILQKAEEYAKQLSKDLEETQE